MKHLISNKDEHFKKACCAALIITVIAMLMISVPIRAAETDDRIESSARQSYLFKTYLNEDDIKIQSKDGAVTLTGVVAESFHKAMAQENVAGLPGVKSVNNLLKVKDAPSRTESDAWLRDKVMVILLFHRSVSARTTMVDVKDGIVILQGEAASQAQKELTAEYARDIEGVIDVNNLMTVSQASIDTARSGKEEDIDDASITAQVKLALLYHRSTNPINPRVETANGNVTLYGVAGSETILNLATRLADDVIGVKSVENRITIERADPGVKGLL
jgi:hyperosmotically inducible periplasmic protein